jgi:hypothetical protein
MHYDICGLVLRVGFALRAKFRKRRVPSTGKLQALES